MKKLKILHINNFDKKGGAETVFDLTWKNLSEFQNFTGFIQTDAEIKPDIKFSNWQDDGKISGSINFIFSYKNYKALYKFLLENEIDIVHLQAYYSPISPSILLALKKIKKKKTIKIIETLHGFHLICPNMSLFNYSKNELCEKCIGRKFKFFIFKDNCDGRGYFYSFLKGIKSLVSNNIINHKKIIDKYIAPSEFLKSKFVEDGIERSNIFVVRNPVLLVKGTANTKKENLICYFGRFSREKNIEFLIKAFSEWKLRCKNNYKLMLIGEGEEKNKLDEMISKTGLSDDAVVKEFMDRERLHNEIKFAKFFALTSKCYENFPMSVAEAVALDILPIVPDIGGMQESVEVFFKIAQKRKKTRDLRGLQHRAQGNRPGPAQGK